jgi:hypothetical protein
MYCPSEWVSCFHRTLCIHGEIRFSEKHGLGRLFLDEIHELLISAEFRPDFAYLWDLARQTCQRIQFTATLPPQLIQYFMEKMALDARFCYFIRGETNRPELRYHVLKVNSRHRTLVSVIAGLARGLQNQHFGANSRGIIFTATKEMAREMNMEMGCFVHFSDKDRTNQRRLNEINMAEWEEGYRQDTEGIQTPQPWLAATPGLINGIDLDCIDAVIFGEEGMAGLFGGVQGTGRGGRSGQPCMCIFVTTGTFNPPRKDNDLCGMVEMKRWTQEEMCLRIVPSENMDGHRMTCMDLSRIFPTTEFCGHCQPNTVIIRLIQNAYQNANPPSHLTPEEPPRIAFQAQSNAVVPSNLRPQITFKPSHGTIFNSKKASAANMTSASAKVTSASTKTTSAKTTLASAKVTSACAKTASASAKTNTGMAIRMNVAIVEDMLNEKYRKSDVLSRALQCVRNDVCYVCWIIQGKVALRGAHEPVIGCGLTFGMGWKSFKCKIKDTLQKYHFCFSCGLPQNVRSYRFEPETHTGFGKNCPVQNMAFQMMFALKRHSETWALICDHFNLEKGLSGEGYSEWALQYVQNTDKYYNGLEVLVWFLETFRF